MPELKHITPTNWLEADGPFTPFFKKSADGIFVPMSGEDWLARILEPKLADTVPSAVHDLFTTARGALAYGYFFYPLYTLGVEQLYRVADAAVTHKCQQRGATRTKNFHSGINWLVRDGTIPKADADRWHAVRELRNITSHPIAQILLTPGLAQTVLEGIVADINALFGAP